MIYEECKLKNRDFFSLNYPKFQNKVLFEKVEDAVNAFCIHCDFILPITEEELKYINETLYLYIG